MATIPGYPQFSLTEATKLVVDLYGLQQPLSLRLLPGERDLNFHVIPSNVGDQGYVLKIFNQFEKISLLEAQQLCMDWLAAKKIDFSPSVIAAQNGAAATKVRTLAGVEHWARMVAYLPGTPLGLLKHRSKTLIRDIGSKIGLLDVALHGFDHAAFHRNEAKPEHENKKDADEKKEHVTDFFQWEFSVGASVVNNNVHLVDEDTRCLVSFLFDRCFVKEGIADLLPLLRKSIIHNDANDYNILVQRKANLYEYELTGIIDMGDVVHSYTVGNLAVALAYMMLDQRDPLATACEFIAGYHNTFPLTELELQVLFPLICLRLCMSACIAAKQQRQQPDNPYLSISQEPIRSLLPKLIKLNPLFVRATFRLACGLEPVPSSLSVTAWLKANASTFAPVLKNLYATPTVVFDLSIDSAVLHGDAEQNAEAQATPRLLALMKKAQADIGIGRYDEPRFIYTSSLFSSGSKASDEARTVHLGIDLFGDAGTPVFAPLAGRVHAFHNNDALQDYGPVIILAHTIPVDVPVTTTTTTTTTTAASAAGEKRRKGELVFYTLYGHLSLESIATLQVGQEIQAGEQLAWFGTSAVNGGWTPHLHFQVIVDLLDMDCDFPGVSLPSQRGVWTSFSPDPNLILQLRAATTGREVSKQSTLSTRRQRLGGNVRLSYADNPVKIVRGWKQYLYDEQGLKYLDAYNNVAHVGHSHPVVVEAVVAQMNVLNTNTRYLSDHILNYAEKLTSYFPPSLSKCYFVNSASEANELALRLARAFTHQRDMIVLEAAYHGNTTSLIDISPYKHDGPGGEGRPDWVHTVPIPDVYRGKYGADDRKAGSKYAAAVGPVLEQLRRENKGLSAFIAESLPSVGGQIVLPPGYLAAVYSQVRAMGGLCIADEVQTGFGRVGTHMWGYELQGVVPDIVVLGKPMGNGHPLAAVITTPAIAASFDNGMEFFSTYGGNPVSCVAGLAVLRVLEEEQLKAHAQRVGSYLLSRLKALQSKYPLLVGDVRGAGLFIGVELVRNIKTKEPAPEAASYVATRMREQHILLGTDGPFHNVVKIRPPMPFSCSDADELSTAFDSILAEMV